MPFVQGLYDSPTIFLSEPNLESGFSGSIVPRCTRETRVATFRGGRPCRTHLYFRDQSSRPASKSLPAYTVAILRGHRWPGPYYSPLTTIPMFCEPSSAIFVLVMPNITAS